MDLVFNMMSTINPVPYLEDLEKGRLDMEPRTT